MSAAKTILEVTGPTPDDLTIVITQCGESITARFRDDETGFFLPCTNLFASVEAALAWVREEMGYEIQGGGDE